MTDRKQLILATIATIVLVVAFVIWAVWILVEAGPPSREHELRRAVKERNELVATCRKIGLRADYAIHDQGGSDVWFEGKCRP